MPFPFEPLMHMVYSVFSFSHDKPCETAQRRGDRDFASIMNAQRLIIEPNRQVDCMVIRRSLMAMKLAGVPINVTGDQTRE